VISSTRSEGTAHAREGIFSAGGGDPAQAIVRQVLGGALLAQSPSADSAPNKALQATANSLRSCVAAAIGGA